jgi:guanine deaminase
MAAATSAGKKLFLGAFAHCKTQTELEIVEHGAIGVDEAGVIQFVERAVGDVEGFSKEGWEDAARINVPKTGWLFPGFIGKWKDQTANFCCVSSNIKLRTIWSSEQRC